MMHRCKDREIPRKRDERREGLIHSKIGRVLRQVLLRKTTVESTNPKMRRSLLNLGWCQDWSSYRRGRLWKTWRRYLFHPFWQVLALPFLAAKTVANLLKRDFDIHQQKMGPIGCLGKEPSTVLSDFFVHSLHQLPLLRSRQCMVKGLVLVGYLSHAFVAWRILQLLSSTKNDVFHSNHLNAFSIDVQCILESHAMIPETSVLV